LRYASYSDNFKLSNCVPINVQHWATICLNIKMSNHSVIKMMLHCPNFKSMVPLPYNLIMALLDWRKTMNLV